MKSRRCAAGIVLLLILGFVSVGCTDVMYGLRPHQKNDIRDWEAAGQPVVHEKNPATATALGFFFGLGSFYTDEPVLGVVDLLLWPISILWDPLIAPANANKINYEATKAAWQRSHR